MATDLSREQRRKEVRDVSFTADKVRTQPTNNVEVLTFADQDVLDTQNPPKIRTELAPSTFHDEDTTYNDLFISDVNAARFQPPQITGEPAPDIYQTREDDIQLKPQEYEENVDCVCADGRASKGRKNIRTGQIDCNCDTSLASKPDIYKPEPNKPRVVDTKPLKDQAGVSYMGNVSLEPCKVESNAAVERARATLNRVIQDGRVEEEEINKGKSVNHTSQHWNIYDNCDYNLYGI